LREIFGPKREEVARGWGRLHNEKQIKENEMGRACSTYGKDEKCTQNFDLKT